MAHWATFATVAGGAAAGLTGLLFVAVSIRVADVARSPELRYRSAQTLALFVTVLFIATLLSVPGQSDRALGAELVALASIVASAMLVLDLRARASTRGAGSDGNAVAASLEVVAPNVLTCGALLASGVLLVSGVQSGLDVLAVPVLFALGGGVVSAWLVLTTTIDS